MVAGRAVPDGRARDRVPADGPGIRSRARSAGELDPADVVIGAPKITGTDVALLLGVYGTFALDVFSTLNSSPQTTELFAEDRRDSLMHWVMIGDAAAIAGGLAGTYFTRSPAPLIAAAAVAAGMHYAYAHAVARGTQTVERF
jgi:hypothetical protein